MAFGDNHEMPVVVRIAVKDDGVVNGPQENKVAFVFLVPQKRAKKAAGTFNGARAQVRLAPRSPHKIFGSLEVHGFLDGTVK